MAAAKMPPNQPFKAIIVGGGIGGLVVANMFEKFGLDYVLLEAHREIAPPAGAGFGMFPNGFLVLDQIGCYEAVIARVSEFGIDRSRTRNRDGKTITSSEGLHSELEQRHGYPLRFFDRHWLLQALYDHLQQKDKVLLGKQFTSIEFSDSGVQVKTKDGQILTGDIVIGADGIHSAVRDEIWRIARETDPGYFPPGEEDRVECSYQCSYGIAQDVVHWPESEMCFTLGEGTSFLVATRPDGRYYWFFCVRLPETKYGKDIPRYSKEDEEAFVEKYKDFRVTEDITFGQIYAKRISSVLSPVHENVCTKWHFKRAVLLGDSVHKPNPIGGMGGNMAIETAAELLNALIDTKNNRPQGLDSMNNEEITAIFSKTQDAAYERAKYIISMSHESQAICAFENPLVSSLIYGVVVPLAGRERVLDVMAKRFLDARRLKHLPVPSRSRLVPYTVELPSKPLKPRSGLLVKAFFTVGMGATLYVANRAMRISAEGIGSWGGLAPLDRNWLGNTVPNKILKVLTSVFSYPLLGSDPNARLQALYFLSQLPSPLLIYTVEGYRAMNQANMLTLPSIFLAVMQLKGIGKIAPVYAILSAFQSNITPGGRYVQPEVATALLPALTISYIVPSVMMILPHKNERRWQDWVALWQIAPPLFSACTAAISAGLRWWKSRQARAAEGNHDVKVGKQEPAHQKVAQSERHRNADVPILRSVYGAAFALQATAHIAALAYSYSQPNVSLVKAFFDLPNPFAPDWPEGTVATKISWFFKYDMLFAFTAALGHNLYTIWDLRHSGYVPSRDAVKAALGVIVGQVAVGPSATWVGLWRWREDVLSGLATLNV